MATRCVYCSRQLDIRYRLVELDILKKETRTQAFLTKNPNGRIPTVEFDDRRCLAESNAIMFYFAQATPLWPDDRYDRADVVRWMFFEQYSHEPFVAVARFLFHLPPPVDPKVLAEKHEKGYAALDIMERHLATQAFFAAGRYTISDIALYAYTHVAAEGRFDLSAYPNIRAWIDRVAAQPRHVVMGTKPADVTP